MIPVIRSLSTKLSLLSVFAAIMLAIPSAAQEPESYEELLEWWPDDHPVVPVSARSKFLNQEDTTPLIARRLSDTEFALSLTTARILRSGSLVDGKTIRWIASSADYCVAVISTAEDEPRRRVIGIEPAITIGDIATFDFPKSDEPRSTYLVGGIASSTLRGTFALCDSLGDDRPNDGAFVTSRNVWGIVIEPAPRPEAKEVGLPFVIKFYAGDSIQAGPWRTMQAWQESNEANHAATAAMLFHSARATQSDAASRAARLLSPTSKDTCLPPDVLLMLYDALRGAKGLEGSSARTCIEFDSGDSLDHQRKIAESINALADLVALPGLRMPEGSGTIEEALADARRLSIARAAPEDVIAALQPAFDVAPSHAIAALQRFSARIRGKDVDIVEITKELLAANLTIDCSKMLGSALLRAGWCEDGVAVFGQMTKKFEHNPFATLIALDALRASIARCDESRAPIVAFANKSLDRFPEMPVVNWLSGSILNSVGEPRLALPPMLKATQALKQRFMIDRTRALALELGDQQALDQLDKIK